MPLSSVLFIYLLFIFFSQRKPQVMSYANLILKILMADASVHDNPNTLSKLWHMGDEESESYRGIAEGDFTFN